MPRIEVQRNLAAHASPRSAAHLLELSTQLRSTTADAAAAAADGAAGSSTRSSDTRGRPPWTCWPTRSARVGRTSAPRPAPILRPTRPWCGDRGRSRAESFAGITVPEGEAGELRSAAKALSGLSHDLESAARDLDGQPTMLGGWAGPASVGIRQGVPRLQRRRPRQRDRGARRQRRAAPLRRGTADAQRDARNAIAQARSAQHRIDRAQHAIVDARARAAAAAARDSAAASKIALTSVVGVPPPDTVAEQARARSDAAAAEFDGAGAQRELEEAERPRPREGRGQRAMEHAHAVARAAAAAFDAASGGGPGAAANGGPPSGVRDGGGIELANVLGSPMTGLEISIGTGAAEQALNLRANIVRRLVTFRGGGLMSGGWRLSGTRTGYRGTWEG